MNAQLMHQIFQSVPHQNLLNCRTVCSTWNKIICEWNYFQDTTAFVISNTVNQISIEKQHPQVPPPFIRTVQIKDFLNFKSFANPALQFLSTNGLQNITSLNFKKCLIDQQLLVSICQIESLQELKLIHSQIQMNENVETEATELNSTNIQCPNLHHLHLYMTITDISYLSRSLLPNLNRLITLKIEEILQVVLSKKLKHEEDDFYKFGAIEERVQTLSILPYNVAAEFIEEELHMEEHNVYMFEPQEHLHLMPNWQPGPGFGHAEPTSNEFWDEHYDYQHENEVTQSQDPENVGHPLISVPFKQELLEAISQNNSTLKNLGISLTSRIRYSAASLLIQEILQALISNQVQLTSLTLNGFNKPLTAVDQIEYETSFRNLVTQFFTSQHELKDLVLGLNGIDKDNQIHIQSHLFPKTVEKLKMLPVTHEQDLLYLPKLTELEIPKDITRQKLREGPVPDPELPPALPGPSWAWRWCILSRNLGIFQEPLKYYLNLKSFVGELLYFTPEHTRLFCKSVELLTKLNIQFTGWSETHLLNQDEFLQIMIKNLKFLIELSLDSSSYTDAGITGFSLEFIKDVKSMNNYPKILPELNVVRSGLPLFNLNYLEVLRIPLRLTDFGIFFGIRPTKLRILDLRPIYYYEEDEKNTFVSEWGLTQMAISLKPHLHELHWNLGEQIGLAAMKDFVLQLPNLNRKSVINHQSLEVVCNKRPKEGSHLWFFQGF